MSAETIKQFYNKHFFQNGQPVATEAILTITIGNEAVKLVGLSLSPNATIEELFKSYHSFLLQTAPKEDLKGEDLAATGVLDIIPINYRNNAYLLDVLENEVFIVRRKDTNEVIKADSPVARGVVKQYRDSV